jgi:hypothetical protein
MAVDLPGLLAELRSSGFREIAGTRVSARIPLSRALINRLVADALAGTTAPVRQVDVRPGTDDRFDVVITVSWPFVPPLTVAFYIEQQPQFPASPVLVLRWSLLGGIGGFASRMMGSPEKLPAGVRLEGDRLVLDIPALAARGAAAALLPYLKALQLRSIDARLVLDVELQVAE